MSSQPKKPGPRPKRRVSVTDHGAIGKPMTTRAINHTSFRLEAEDRARLRDIAKTVYGGITQSAALRILIGDKHAALRGHRPQTPQQDRHDLARDLARFRERAERLGMWRTVRELGRLMELATEEITDLDDGVQRPEPSTNQKEGQ